MPNARFDRPHPRDLAIAAVLAVAIFFASAFAAQAERFYTETFGTTSALSSGSPPSPSGTAFGGFFGTGNGGIGDIAVNDPAIADGNGADGWVYVVDRGHNRIQAFDADLDFQWAVGRDVIAATVSEVQILTVDATAGQFKLEFNGQTTVVDLAHNASASAIDSALGALSTIGGAANVVVSGSPVSDSNPLGRYAIQFAGTLANANQNQITIQPGTTPLTGTASISTLADGTNAVPGDQGVVFEKCVVAAHCKAAATGSLGGELNVARGIDIDQDSGDLFVRESNSNSRVQQYAADGDWVRAFGWDVVQDGSSGDTPDDSFETCNAAANDLCKAAVTGDNLGTAFPGRLGASSQVSTGLTVAPQGAPNAGQVYAADPFNCRIQPYTIPVGASGAVTAETPFGVPSSGPNTPPSGDGEFCATAVTRTWPRDLAADRTGVVYGNSGTAGASNRVKRFDTTVGDFLPLISGVTHNPLEVDPATDHLLIAGESAEGIMELDLTDKPGSVEDWTSRIVDRHAVGLGATANALGAGHLPGRYFVSTSSTIGGTGTGHRVLVLDDTGVEPHPLVEIDPVGDVGSTTASFSGHIDPVLDTGFQTFYRWQVSKDGVDWTDVTPSQLVPPDGFTPSNVSHAATGLEPNTLYRLRIRTDRVPAAGFSFSSETTFHTDPMPPEAQTLAARQVTDSSAHLVGRLHPGGLVSDYWFEWGDTDLQNTIPVPPRQADGGIARLVGETLNGLEPDRVYSYRLCAENQQSSGKVCGTTETFQTRSAANSLADGRGYEMVLPPDKPIRRGGGLGNHPADIARFNNGVPALEGGVFRSYLFASATDAESGARSTRDHNYELRRRQPGGLWKGDAIFNIAPPTPGGSYTAAPSGESSSLMASGWQLVATLFENKARAGIRVIDDSGGIQGAGWYTWLDPAWFPGQLSGQNAIGGVIDDDSLLAQGFDDALYRDVTPGDGGPAPQTPTPSSHPVLDPPQTAGSAVFVGYREHGWRPFDLVNECSGAGGSATLLPARDDNGTPSGPSGSFSLSAVTYSAGSDIVNVFTGSGQSTSSVRVGHYILSDAGGGIPADARVVEVISNSSFRISANTTGGATFQALTGGQRPENLVDDTIGTRVCEAGSPTDVRGAIIGSRRSGRLGNTSAATMSEDGRRIFFASPDPSVGTGQNGCEVDDAAVGEGTACPAQLFVRQFDDAGNPTVRWLSRPEDALLFEGGDPEGDPQMRPESLGTGVAFEGASHDGRYVFFRTDAPLLESDPNGGLDPVVEASRHSWDLYRYDLGADVDADPAAGDPGSRLTRISGGPGGAADPNTNCAVVQTGACIGTTSGAPNGEGTALRFVSDDGSRLYFVTTAEIPGADNAPPVNSGSANAPSGVGDQVNGATRNLYYYDTATGEYRFVARLPFSTSNDNLDACATAHGIASTVPRFVTATTGEIVTNGNNCVHGSASGDAVVFETSAPLTADDVDDSLDVYVYEADGDRLTRLSAPPADSGGYECLPGAAACNGDLGYENVNAVSFRESGLFGSRHRNVSFDANGDLEAVFFESRLPLVAGDANASDDDGDGGMDVYQWRPDGGGVSLVSPGDVGGDSAFYSGNSLDGTDVYFFTEQRLSPWEIDEADGDIYNATTRSDLRPPPRVAPPVCEVFGDGCQGGGAGVVASDPRTTGGAGGGNAPPVARARLAVGAVGAKARRRAARTGLLALRVRSSRAGVVRLVARARIGRGVSQVGRGAVRLDAARSVTVDLRLSRQARRRLRSGKALRVIVRATAPRARARTATVLLPGVGR